MVDVYELNPGDKVKIVDEWGYFCGQNPSGLMDEYLGTIMTVMERSYNSVRMEEDEGRWSWNKYCIDYVVNEVGEDFEVASDDELEKFILT